MDQIKLEQIQEALAAVRDLIPKDGGHVSCEVIGPWDMLTIGGDRVGVLRLGLTILSYATEAALIPGTQVTSIQKSEEMFSVPSDIRCVELQINEAPRKSIPNHSRHRGVSLLIWLMLWISLGIFLLLGVRSAWRILSGLFS